MSWETFVTQIDWFDGESWGDNVTIRVLSQAERDKVLDCLFEIYSSSPSTGAWMDALVASQTLRIGKSADNSAGNDSPSANYFGINFQAIAQIFFINQTGELVQEDPRNVILHELLHLHLNNPNPDDGIPLTDSYFNGINPDVRGDILRAQEPILIQMGLGGLIQPSFHAAGYSGARVNSLNVNDSYTDGNIVELARWGDQQQLNQVNTIDHSSNTTAVDDLIFGFGGSDTIHAALGEDYVYGGDGNDEVHGETQTMCCMAITAMAVERRATTSCTATLATTFSMAAQARTRWTAALVRTLSPSAHSRPA